MTIYANENGTWKLASPYVNNNGTWKLAVGYANYAGGWDIASGDFTHTVNVSFITSGQYGTGIPGLWPGTPSGSVTPSTFKDTTLATLKQIEVGNIFRVQMFYPAVYVPGVDKPVFYPAPQGFFKRIYVEREDSSVVELVEAEANYYAEPFAEGPLIGEAGTWDWSVNVDWYKTMVRRVGISTE